MKTTKRSYLRLIETMVLHGYDISDMLNPTYKNIDAQKCLDYANQILEDYYGKDYWDHEDKLTLENI